MDEKELAQQVAEHIIKLELRVAILKSILENTMVDTTGQKIPWREMYLDDLHGRDYPHRFASASDAAREEFGSRDDCTSLLRILHQRTASSPLK